MKTISLSLFSFILLPFIAIILSGCNTGRPLFLSDAYHKEKIDIITLLPVADLRFDKSKDLKNLDRWVHNVFKRQLKRKRYPFNILLESSLVANVTEEDITDPKPHWISTLGPSGARWILLPILHDSSSKLTFGSTGNAEFSAALYDRENGTMIWRHKAAQKAGAGGLAGMAMKGSMEKTAILEAATEVISFLPASK